LIGGETMQRVNVREARQQISRLLDAVAAGEEIVIMRRGKPAARLLPASENETGPMRFSDRSTFRAMIPPAKLTAAELIREMRDERG
jgi:prevent-host-death family protein